MTVSTVQRLPVHQGRLDGTRPRYPFPRYPTSWFQVAWSDEVEPGQAIPLQYFGRDLVLFRTEQGEVKVLDAFCPHLGAHLGHGGKVVGDTITCPFHAWKFNGAGECIDIPYAKKIPKKARVECWPVREVSGAVMVWHDVDNRPPLWELPDFAEFSSEEWTQPVRKEWKLRTHNQEMAENAVDSAHFRYLHGTLNQPEAKVEMDGPLMHMVSNTLMKTPAGNVEGQVESHSYGFGYASNRFTGLVETLLMGNVSPIDDDYVHVRFTFIIKKFAGADIMKGVGRAFVAEITRQLEQDAPVWENKIYFDRPTLCDGDGPIAQYRKWTRQFYPDWYMQEAQDAYYGSNGKPV